MQAVNVHEVMVHAIANSISETYSKRLNIRQELHAANDRVTADPARLQQVFWNLLRNATKFTPIGGSITIRTANPGNDGRLLVEIKDSGVGIAAENLPRIFDAFEQGDTRATLLFNVRAVSGWSSTNSTRERRPSSRPTAAPSGAEVFVTTLSEVVSS